MAGDTETKPLSELEREAENSRANLMHTVDTLQSRVTPRAIKEDIKEYARDTGNNILQNVERQIRNNPLQAAAIATGLAYPLWRLISTIPAPIVLIGAGIALTQSGPKSVRTGGSYSNGNGLSRSAEDASATISRAASDLTHRVTEAADSAAVSVKALGAQAVDTVGDAVHAAQGVASNSAAAASDALSNAYHAGADIADKAEHQVQETFAQTKDTLTHAIENNPLVVGAIGLLVGGFVASCIPATTAENRAFGEISDQLKERAQQVASEGAEVVKAAADQVYDKAVSQATQQGITSDLVRDTVRDAGDKVRAVAEKAIDQLDQVGAGSRPAGQNI